MSRPDWLTAFAEASGLASRLVGERAVADRWEAPSALQDLTVGGVAAHLATAIRRFEVALDEELPAQPHVLAVSEFYGLNRVDEPAGLDEGWHPVLREDAERRAGRGAEDVARRFDEVVSRLLARLPGESPDRLIPVWTVADGATPLAVYVATRVVELVVHGDDLATSVDLPPLDIPPVAAATVIDVFVETARHRTGDLGVIRAFARRERAEPGALRAL